jgi:DNA polymerase-3 subunit epsilon
VRYIVFDLETTGLDVENSRITELGYALYERNNPVPLVMRADFIKQEAPLTEEIQQITGLNDEILEEFGRPPGEVFEEFYDFVHLAKPEFLAGHNAIGFDVPFLKNEMARNYFTLKELPCLDTKIDLPLKYKPRSTHLGYMAADHGFLNPFPHRALFDVLTTGKLISHYNLDLLVDIIKYPIIEVRAVVSFERKDFASKAGFYWDRDRKLWLKKIRSCNFEKEQHPEFQVVVVNG